MADFKSHSPDDRNRDGMPDDIDRKPGNSNDSASYARRYDPRSEQEFTTMQEPQDALQEQIYAEAMREERKRAKNAMRAAMQDVHFFPDAGKFIIPAENTWAAHADIVSDKDMRLYFNPDKFVFDKTVAEQSGIAALADKKHPDYEKYESLRLNLAVLRNDIIGMYLDDGGFDKGDEVYLPIIKSIAEVLGQSLANDVAWKRPFMPYMSREVANVEAVGAAEMYKFLLRTQDSSQTLAGFKRGLRELMGTPDKNWGLLPLEKSPFSPEALSAAPPNLGKLAVPDSVRLEQSATEKRTVESLSLIAVVNNQFKPVENISTHDKALSVEDGRTILRWLRNLQGMDMDVQDFLSAGSAQEQMAKAEALSTLVKLTAAQIQHCPALHNDALVKEGADAAGGAAMMIAEHALAMLPENSPARALLASAIDTMPESFYERSTQSTARLLDHMEIALSKISGQQIGERTAVDRLLEASERMHQHAKQLRSVETLTPPKREESVELGRDILRKLRGMMFDDKPLEEQMNTGKPEDKAAIVEKIEEMVEIYRNILSDALAVNPGLANDQRIKDANDAVGGMTHGIKLMASKDIPMSVAQTQQISADITQMPGEWKNMDGRAMDRLLDTMEGALEAAVDSIDAAAQSAQKDAELAQDAIEASAQASQNNNKRRKRRAGKSGITGKQSEKKMREIMADDMAADQGIHALKKDEQREKPTNNVPVANTQRPSRSNRSTTNPVGSSRCSGQSSNRFGGQPSRSANPQSRSNSSSNSPYLGLNAKDIAAIKSLGSTLRGAGDKAKSVPMAEVSLSTSVSPDDKSAAERAIENITNARKNPNNHRTT